MKQQLIVSTLTVVDFLQAHPRRVGAALAAVLMGSAGGAYAVATRSPMASMQPVHLVTESLEQSSVREQAQALQAHHLTLYRSAHVRASDTPQSLLERLGVADPDAAQFLRSNTLTRQLLLGQGGRSVSAEASEDGTLKALRSTWLEPGDAPKYKRLLVQRDAAGTLQARVESGTPTRTQRLASGVVRSTLRAAADEAGVPESVVRQMASIFEGSVDVQRAMRKGDRFSLVYETLEADGGEELRAGRVLSAEIEHRGKQHQALWFAEKGQPGSYYTFDGHGMTRTFLSSPLRVPQNITSGFGMRVHPVTKERKGHTGVDYAAPRGTPVYSVGPGKVDFAGTQNGYGKLVIVRHRDRTVETRYAHLTRIDVKEGDIVAAGDLVGAIGSTGVATGPHLHFEWRINGDPVNPVPQLANYREPSPLSAAGKKALAARADEMRAQLAAASEMQHANFE